MKIEHQQRFQAAEARLLETPRGLRHYNPWTKNGSAPGPLGTYRPSGFARLDSIVRASGAAERFRYGGDDASTDPYEGEITLPEPERFTDPRAYARTVAHELVHWTGWEGELNRPKPEGTIIHMLLGLSPDNYAREEMTAELGVVLLLDAAGVPADLRYSSEYYQTWRGRLGATLGAQLARDENGEVRGPPDYDDTADVEWARAHAQEAVDLLLNRAGL